MPLTPGDNFSECRITRALGRGAFGTLYLVMTPQAVRVAPNGR